MYILNFVNAEQENAVDSQGRLFSIDLQRFAEEADGDSEDIDVEDIDTEEDDLLGDDILSGDLDDNTGEKEPEPAEPDKSKQTKEDNALYAKMRRKAETEARLQLETERQRIEREKEELMHEKQIIQAQKVITPEMIEQAADTYGTTTDVAYNILYQQIENKMLKERQQQLQRHSDIQTQKASLKNEPFFIELEKEVDSMLANNPDVDAKTAFYYLRGLKSPELLAKLSKEAEKRTTANIHDRMKRGGVIRSDGGSADDVDVNTVLSREGLEMALAFGNNPKDVARYVKSQTKKKG